MGLFSKTENVLGVDIGTTSIKAVEIQHASSQKPSLQNYGDLHTYGYLERFNNALQTSSLRLSEQETANYLKLLLNKAGITTKRAVASLPPFSTFSTLLEIPMMTETETAQAIEYQARQYVPLPLAEVLLDWHVVGKRTDEGGNENQQILLNSVAKEHIQRYQKIFSLAGLELVAIENEGTALARVFTQNEPKPVLIIDIGSRSTGFFAAQAGTLKLVSQTDFSGGSITQSIANSLNIPTTRAEEMKKRQAIGAKDQNSELSTLIETILDVIMNDVRRVKDNFEASYREKVLKIILTGGGANLAGIEEYVSRQLGLPTVKGNPFAALNFPQKLEPVIKDLGSHIAAAIGLGLRATE